ncbi:hypothetical protein PRZ48_010506 [Zasmidium cellare]|uniref:AAA+ ATPase domain-containing protein n=1 Tax=Zasmidium cellare TaxID=395010 RepID=A0ABR0E8V5_ZASCE|nr:hypothetical protein PRZ48_010506 [Zasmidium cellare]
MESQVVNDALAKLEALDATPEIENEGELCEFHSYDAFRDKRGETTILQSGHRGQMLFETQRSHDVALVLTRYYDEERTLEDTELEIKSPYIKAALRKVVRRYPGMNISGSRNIVISGEPRCLFHYRNELRDHAIRSTDGNVVEHMSMCLTYMTRRLQKEILAFNTLMKVGPEKAGIDSEYLWMAFRPGILVYSNQGGVERIYKLVDIQIFRGRRPLRNAVFRGGWHLDVLRIESDGNAIGHVRDSLHIKPYDGYKPLRELECYPLQYHPDPARVKRDLIARANKYLSLLGIHFRMYRGPKKLSSKPWRRNEPELDVSAASPEVNGGEHARNRVIIDSAYYHEEEQSSVLEFMPEERSMNVEAKSIPDLKEEELLICTHLMPGFSLATKAWDLFDVTKLDPIPFNENAFKDMVLPAERKSMIESLVRREGENSKIGKDLVTGKGKGIVFLLHGPPGVGKTLTAESIADFTHRPLYTINCSDLSHIPSIVERTLEETLGLTKRWNAITLIDEADVFMAERTVESSRRNELVSVLLRRLESFEGVMFLTTNRVQAVDEAFMSRVHLSIAYPALSPASRREIWKVFARQNLPAQEMTQWLDDRFLAAVSAANVNGRQIRNAVGVAHALASNENRAMTPEDVRTVFQTLQSFNREFKQQASRKRLREARDDAVTGSSKRARVAEDEEEYYNDHDEGAEEHDDDEEEGDDDE